MIAGQRPDAHRGPGMATGSGPRAWLQHVDCRQRSEPAVSGRASLRRLSGSASRLSGATSQRRRRQAHRRIVVERSSGAVAAAFEVEHTTSIYSGIVRLLATWR